MNNVQEFGIQIKKKSFKLFNHYFYNKYRLRIFINNRSIYTVYYDTEARAIMEKQRIFFTILYDSDNDESDYETI